MCRCSPGVGRSADICLYQIYIKYGNVHKWWCPQIIPKMLAPNEIRISLGFFGTYRHTVPFMHARVPSIGRCASQPFGHTVHNLRSQGSQSHFDPDSCRKNVCVSASCITTICLSLNTERVVLFSEIKGFFHDPLISKAT